MKSAAATAGGVPSPNDDMLRPADVRTLLKHSKSTFYRGIAAGDIPDGVRVPGGKRWSRTELLAWLEAGAPSADEWKRCRQADVKRR